MKFKEEKKESKKEGKGHEKREGKGHELFEKNKKKKGK